MVCGFDQQFPFAAADGGDGIRLNALRGKTIFKLRLDGLRPIERKPVVLVGRAERIGVTRNDDFHRFALREFGQHRIERGTRVGHELVAAAHEIKHIAFGRNRTRRQRTREHAFDL